MVLRMLNGLVSVGIMGSEVVECLELRTLCSPCIARLVSLGLTEHASTSHNIVPLRSCFPAINDMCLCIRLMHFPPAEHVLGAST
jgi:hypothetical protein